MSNRGIHRDSGERVPFQPFITTGGAQSPGAVSATGVAQGDIVTSESFSSVAGAEGTSSPVAPMLLPPSVVMSRDQAMAIASKMNSAPNGRQIASILAQIATMEKDAQAEARDATIKDRADSAQLAVSEQQAAAELQLDAARANLGWAIAGLALTTTTVAVGIGMSFKSFKSQVAGTKLASTTVSGKSLVSPAAVGVAIAAPPGAPVAGAPAPGGTTAATPPVAPKPFPTVDELKTKTQGIADHAADTKLGKWASFKRFLLGGGMDELKEGGKIKKNLLEATVPAKPIANPPGVTTPPALSEAAQQNGGQVSMKSLADQEATIKDLEGQVKAAAPGDRAGKEAQLKKWNDEYQHDYRTFESDDVVKGHRSQLSAQVTAISNKVNALTQQDRTISSLVQVLSSTTGVVGSFEKQQLERDASMQQVAASMQSARKDINQGQKETLDAAVREWDDMIRAVNQTLKDQGDVVVHNMT